MKRAIALLLTLFLVTALAPALADTLPAGSSLAEDTPVAADLDGDGVSEHVSWSMDMEAYDGNLTLIVEPADGPALTYDTGLFYCEGVYILDLDGDGTLEILMTGDEMSADYFTFCLHYADGALYEVLFPDANRGENTDGYFRAGYGRITVVGDNRLTLSGSQDVLGTWFASRTFTLAPSGRFEFADDGLWVRDPEDDLWDSYLALTAKAYLPYTNEKGVACLFHPGAKLFITASDKREAAWFITPEGVSGTLAISPGYRGWGWLVDGVPEEECFEIVPYGD